MSTNFSNNISRRITAKPVSIFHGYETNFSKTSDEFYKIIGIIRQMYGKY